MKIAGSERKLLISQAEALNIDKADVQKWYSYYKFIPKGACMVDRTEQVVLPFRYENKFPIPTDIVNFNKSYDEICVETAEHYLKLSREQNIPILLLWSGGIDSTAVVTSFILAGAHKDEIVIALNNYSIIENFKFYHNHIRGRYNIISVEGLFDFLNGHRIVIGGEGNDQLFGDMVIMNTVRRLTGSIDLIFEPHTENIITNVWIKRGIPEENAKFWYYLLSNHSKKYNIEVPRIVDLFWWFNFAFKWQSVYYRIITRVNDQIKPLINKEFLTKYSHQFFMNDDFQKWSMVNRDKKIANSYQSYKLASKEFIYKFDKNKDYFEKKLKYGSLGKVFEHRVVPDALTSEYDFIDKLNPLEFYVEDNSFS